MIQEIKKFTKKKRNAEAKDNIQLNWRTLQFTDKLSPNLVHATAIFLGVLDLVNLSVNSILLPHRLGDIPRKREGYIRQCFMLCGHSHTS
jgi:hypothetical protein